MSDGQWTRLVPKAAVRLVATVAFFACSVVALGSVALCLTSVYLLATFPEANSRWTLLFLPAALVILYVWKAAFDVWLDFLIPPGSFPIDPIGNTIVAADSPQEVGKPIKKRGFLSWTEGEADAFFSRWAMVALLMIVLFGSQVVAWLNR